MSAAEELFMFQIKAAKLPEPVREYRFDPARRWRFDFAWHNLLGHKIAVEIEGATWSGGRHTRGSGFEKDCEKYNEAQLAGWRIYRFTTGQVKSGAALSVIEKAILRGSGDV